MFASSWRLKVVCVREKGMCVCVCGGGGGKRARAYVRPTAYAADRSACTFVFLDDQEMYDWSVYVAAAVESEGGRSVWRDGRYEGERKRARDGRPSGTPHTAKQTFSDSLCLTFLKEASATRIGSAGDRQGGQGTRGGFVAGWNVGGEGRAGWTPKEQNHHERRPRKSELQALQAVVRP